MIGFYELLLRVSKGELALHNFVADVVDECVTLRKNLENTQRRCNELLQENRVLSKALTEACEEVTDHEHWRAELIEWAKNELSK